MWDFQCRVFPKMRYAMIINKTKSTQIKNKEEEYQNKNKKKKKESNYLLQIKE